MAALLLDRDFEAADRCGEFRLVVTIKEKPVQRNFINAGIYVLEPEVVADLPKNTALDMTSVLETIVGGGGDVAVFPIREFWLDIGQHEDYASADGHYDRGLAASEVEGRIRGFDPWPGVWARCGGQRMRLVAGQALDDTGDAPAGTLEGAGGGGVILACAGGTRLLLTTVQPEGRRAIGAADALNGRQLRIGDRLERPADED